MIKTKLRILLLAAFFAISISSFAFADLGIAFLGSIPTAGSAHDMDVVGNYVYLGDWDAGLAVIDISTAWAPQVVASYNTSGLSNSVQVVGDYAYVADWSHGISIINISNPTSPQLASFWDSPGTAYNLFVMGNYAYLADFNRGLTILDVSNQTSPQFVSSYSPGSFVCGIWGQGNYIYLADLTNGLLTFNVSDPDTAMLTDAFHTDGDAFNITGGGGNLYLSDGLRGIKIFSIASDPAHPAFLTTIQTSGYVNDAFLADTILYVADDSAGALLYSVAIPSLPYELARYDSPGVSRGIFAAPPFFYLGDSDSFIVLYYGELVGINEDSNLPSEFDLKGIYPNPFNPQATIEFSLKQRTAISLDAYNIAGQFVANLAAGSYDAGQHAMVWNASNLPSGIYFVRMSADGLTKTIKATILK